MNRSAQLTLEEELLKLRASMILKPLDSRGSPPTSYSLRAFYFAKEAGVDPCNFNPFQHIDHRYKDELVKSFEEGRGARDTSQTTH